jgi:uncharacterized membrane protein YbaN (DUF454 family)
MPERSRALRIAWNVAGTIALVIGILGVLLPLLPGTMFLILAAACYLRGSERMHRWLIEHRLFGHHIRNYHEGRGIPMRAKITILAMMWFSIVLAAVRLQLHPAAMLLVGLGIIGTIVILRVPTLIQLDPPGWPEPRMKAETEELRDEADGRQR